MREFFIGGAELLFQMTSGVPMFEGLYIIAYIAVMVILAMLLVFCTIGHTPGTYRHPLNFVIVMVGMVVLFGGMFSFIAAQQTMLVDCKSVEVTISTELIPEQGITVTQCRYKDNYYGDFGEWKVVTLR
jgi:hypothetical protein